MSFNNTIASNGVSASASKALVIPTDKSIERFEIDLTEMEQGLKNFCLANGEEFASIVKSKLVKEFDLRINGEVFTCSLDKDYYSRSYRLFMWNTTTFKTTYKTHFNFKVLSGTNIGDAIAAMQEAIVATAKALEERQMEEEQERIADAMWDVVAAAQESVDAIVTDFGIIAEKTKLDIFAKKQCLVRIKDICEQCLVDCGKISGCEMVWDDGFHPSLEGLKNLAVENISDLEGFINTLDSMLEMEYPLDFGMSEEDMQYLQGDGCYCFDGYPWYLWQDMREFASTYYHYAYCA